MGKHNIRRAIFTISRALISSFYFVYSPRLFINGKEEQESLPAHIQQMFTLLEEKDFRVDISSTELRKQLSSASA